MLHPRFSASSRAALLRAHQLATKNRSEVVGTAHLLLVLLQENRGAQDEADDDRLASLLLLSGVNREEVRLYAEAALGVGETDAASTDFYSRELSHVLRWALDHTYEEIVEPEHLLVALVQPQSGPHIGEIVRPLGLQPGELGALLRQIEREERYANRPLRMLDKNSRAVLKAAHAAMRAGFCGRVSSLHLLIGLLDTPSPIRVFLRKQGVNLDALGATAARAQTNDGAVGGPAMQLAPDAKRAIARAKSLAFRSQRGDPQPKIAPEHLWLALLPQSTSWHEWLRANDTEDPLEAVWQRIDSAPLERALYEYMGGSTIHHSWSQLLNSPPPKPKNVNVVHLRWDLVMAGVAFHLVWLFLELEPGAALLLIATFAGIMLAMTGALTRSRFMRDGAASWLWGLIAGIFLAWIVGAGLS